MTRYFAGSAATRKNAPLRTGYTDIEAAKTYAAFLADTYGGYGYGYGDGDGGFRAA